MVRQKRDQFGDEGKIGDYTPSTERRLMGWYRMGSRAVGHEQWELIIAIRDREKGHK